MTMTEKKKNVIYKIDFEASAENKRTREKKNSIEALNRTKVKFAG